MTVMSDDIRRAIEADCARLINLYATLNDAAAAVEHAVIKAIEAGNRTGDIFSASESGAKRVGTREMGDAIATGV